MNSFVKDLLKRSKGKLNTFEIYIIADEFTNSNFKQDLDGYFSFINDLYKRELLFIEEYRNLISILDMER